MMNEIQPYKEEKPVMMKGGLVHWVTPETWTKIDQLLVDQTNHQFIRIKELGITINTAEVEGTYTIKQYEDYEKVKQGMWQCLYRNWHNKGKKECDCKADFYKRQRQAEEEKEREEMMRPLTPEEEERSRKALRRVKEFMVLNGTFGQKPGEAIRRSTIVEWEQETGKTFDNKNGIIVEEDVI